MSLQWPSEGTYCIQGSNAKSQAELQSTAVQQGVCLWMVLWTYHSSVLCIRNKMYLICITGKLCKAQGMSVSQATMHQGVLLYKPSYLAKPSHWSA